MAELPTGTVTLLFTDAQYDRNLAAARARLEGEAA
jgi:hypothetical protein